MPWWCPCWCVVIVVLLDGEVERDAGDVVVKGSSPDRYKGVVLLIS